MHKYFNPLNEKMAKAIENAGRVIKMPRESLLSSVQIVDNYERLIDRCDTVLQDALEWMDATPNVEWAQYDSAAHLIEDLHTVMKTTWEARNEQANRQG